MTELSWELHQEVFVPFVLDDKGLFHQKANISVPDQIGTKNEIVYESIYANEPKGYEVAKAKKPKSKAEVQVDNLTAQLARKTDENITLKNRIKELEAKVAQLLENSPGKLGRSMTSKNLSKAKLIDSAINEDS